jgi:hypothetical protein
MSRDLLTDCPLFGSGLNLRARLLFAVHRATVETRPDRRGAKKVSDGSNSRAGRSRRRSWQALAPRKPHRRRHGTLRTNSNRRKAQEVHQCRRRGSPPSGAKSRRSPDLWCSLHGLSRRVSSCHRFTIWITLSPAAFFVTGVSRSAVAPPHPVTLRSVPELHRPPRTKVSRAG